MFALRCSKLVSMKALMDCIMSISEVDFCKFWNSQSSFQMVFFAYKQKIPSDMINNALTMCIQQKFDLECIEENVSEPAEEIYIFSLPEVINHSSSILSLVHSIDEMATIKHPPGLYVITPSTPDLSIIIQLYFAQLKFDGENQIKMVVNDSYQVPYLLIQNFPETTTKEELVEVFTDLGYQLDFIEIVKNEHLHNITAEIILPSNEEAQRFTEQVNYNKFGENTIFIRHYLSPKQLQEMKEWRIKVTRIRQGLNVKDIANIFSRYGEIFSVTLKETSSIIEYRNKASAEAVIANPPPDFGVSYLFNENWRMIAMNFPKSITKERVQGIFPAATNIKIVNAKYEGVRPIVQITFNEKAKMFDAINRGNKLSFEGMRLICIKFKEFHDTIGNIQKSMTPENSVFVINISERWNMEDIVRELKQFGDILYIKFSAANGKKTGFAGVLFADSKSVPRVFAGQVKGITVKRFQKPAI